MSRKLSLQRRSPKERVDRMAFVEEEMTDSKMR